MDTLVMLWRDLSWPQAAVLIAVAVAIVFLYLQMDWEWR